MIIIINRHFMKSIYTLLILLIILMISGCRTQHDMSYLNDIRQYSEGSIQRSNYKITVQPDDELAITVTSSVPEATASYNLPYSNPIVRSTGRQVSDFGAMQTYVVNQAGDISFPRLGQVHVAGMTIEQIGKKLTEEISRDVKDPIVMVRLVNFKVNVIGEVRGPRSINVTTERFSLLDALAAAGDLSEYGNRENVTVLRELPDGQISYCHLNLRDSKITQSPYFYLQQNDVVIVDPNNIKQANSKYNQNNAYKLSVTSTIVSAASIIASLIIALTLK